MDSVLKINKWTENIIYEYFLSQFYKSITYDEFVSKFYGKPDNEKINHLMSIEEYNIQKELNLKTKYYLDRLFDKSLKIYNSDYNNKKQMFLNVLKKYIENEKRKSNIETDFENE